MLCDGEQVRIRETATEDDRNRYRSFYGGLQKDRDRRSEMFGERTDSGRDTMGYDAKEIDRVARQRAAPIAIQTDKDTYVYGSDIIVTITNPYFVLGEQMSLSVTDDMENVHTRA